MTSERHVVADKYQLVRLLGRGGMGEVYEAQHLATGRHVALKVLRLEAPVYRGSDETERPQEVLLRFQREARAVGAMSSPHIVQVFDAGIDGVTGQAFMAMELLAGEDVSSLLARVGPLAPLTVVKIAVQACEALASAHRAGVVHRDVKPANLYLAHDAGGVVTVKIVDFGIARVPKPDDAPLSLTQTGSLLGSPMYMAPEQAFATRPIDHRVDLWSLGVVLYKMIAGVTPHERPGIGLAEILMAICSEDPPPLSTRAPWAPPQLAHIVNRALQRDPDRRYASADEMFRDLRALLPPSPEAAVLTASELQGTRAPLVALPLPQRPPAVWNAPSAPATSSRRWVLGFVFLAVVAAVAAFGGALVFGELKAWREATEAQKANTTQQQQQALQNANRDLPVASLAERDVVQVTFDGRVLDMKQKTVHMDGPPGTVHTYHLLYKDGDEITYHVTLTTWAWTMDHPDLVLGSSKHPPAQR